MGRLGLEPRTNGLTCRTGFHRPPAWAGLRSGPSLRPRLDVRAGGVWPLRALRFRGLPADRPIPRIFTALSRWYLGLSGGSSKQPPTDQWFTFLALLFRSPLLYQLS